VRTVSLVAVMMKESSLWTERTVDREIPLNSMELVGHREVSFREVSFG
jgi:hypothetical protein